jgi:hypothetical protein
MKLSNQSKANKRSGFHAASGVRAGGGPQCTSCGCDKDGNAVGYGCTGLTNDCKTRTCYADKNNPGICYGMGNNQWNPGVNSSSPGCVDCQD